jgi:glycosyltransferase involved in cell wall biosynthesis
VRVLADERLRRRLAEGGRRSVERAFDWTEIRARLVATIGAQLEEEQVART